jgi:hypothetical protein
VRLRATPGEQRVGRLRVAVSVGPIARMFAAGKWRDPDNSGGGAVFEVADLHYGNNVALEDAGRYRVLITIAASPLTGTDGAERCEFTFDFDAAQASR